MTTRLTILLRLLGVALLAVLLLATPAMAQDDDDDDDGHQHSTQTVSGDDDDRDDSGSGAATSGADDDRFGAFIRAGSCEAPGDVVEDIDELDDDDRDDDGDDWQKVGGNDPRPDVFFSEEEDIEQSIDELTGGDFVVTIHEGGSADSAVIACGEISGEVDADGTLLIDLEEVDGSGFEGRAHFGPDDDDSDDDGGDDDQTEATVGLWEVAPEGV